MSTPVQAPANAAFEFIRSLAGELSRGNVDLPAFPEIAVRVRRILSDPRSSIEQVVRVVGSEPALAARLLRIANAASINRSGRTVTDLRSAINRIGYNMVRSASISFAMAEIRNSNKLAGIEHHLEALWRRSTQVAAFAFVLARTCTHVNPDEAMLTGMMHGIGKLYVLTRATAHPEFFANAATLTQIIEDWHPSIGKAILENWGFAEAVAQAVGDQLDHSRTQMQPPDLSDIIAAAVVMAEYSGDAAALETALKELPEPKRLGLNQARTAAVMRESAAEVSALTDALGG